MKKRYLAMTLGLILTLTPVYTYAAASAKSLENSGSSAAMQGNDSDNLDGNSGESSAASQGNIPDEPDGKNGELSAAPQGSAPDKLNGENGDSSAAMQENTPDKPDGKNGEPPAAPQGNVPDKPDGENGEPPAAMQGNAPDKPEGEPGNMAGGGPGGPGGMTQAPSEYTAVKSFSEYTALSDETITSTGTDENAIWVSGDANVILNHVTVDRTSQDSTGGDNSSFYGVGAALLATDGTLSIQNSSITTDVAGGAGIFAYGDGTVYAADCDITTQQGTSGALHAAGGGTLYAWNVTAETNGTSAAAVRSDRGGGTMVIDEGSYTSNGQDSPAVYCTADIAIKDATLTANGSEAVCIEGLNTLRLYDCDLSGNMPDDERNDNTWSVIVYQSMSGDSQIGNGTFQMEGGTLTSGNGGLFYTTNTECTITLKDVDISASEDSEFLLQCTGNDNSRGWGQSGANGSDCLFTAISQTLQGDVIWDSISELNLYLSDKSILTGAIRNDETYTSEGGDGYCKVTVDASSTWTVTGDCQVTSLSNAGTITDPDGRSVTIQGRDGTIFQEGDSDYTIITDAYNDTADLSGRDSVDDWSDHEISKPDSLL